MDASRICQLDACQNNVSVIAEAMVQPTPRRRRNPPRKVPVRSSFNEGGT